MLEVNKVSWTNIPHILIGSSISAGIFAKATYAFTTIPTYPSGQIGFIIASKSADLDLTTPKREVTEDMKLQYYTPEIHKVAFVLPAFAKAKLNA